MENKRFSAENRSYFEFIDELKKSSRKDSPTAEISRMYKEVADILAEAFDEFNPEDLPKYQDRLDGIIRLQQTESSLSDPLFKEDVSKAKSLLDQKIKQRYGAVQKISKLASGTLRTLGGVSSHVRDFISIGEQSAEAGRRFGQLNFGVGQRRLDPEEERRQYDILKGNDLHTSNTTNNQSNSPSAGPNNNTDVLPVKDDKLIGTNNQQNKVLIELFNVTKDSNANIKQIKALIRASSAQESRRQSKEDLNQKEEKQEKSASVKTKDKGFIAELASVLGVSGLFGKNKGTQGGDSEVPTDQKSSVDLPTVGGIGGLMSVIGAIASKAVGIVGGATTGGWAGSKVFGPIAKPLKTGAQGLTTSVGEWTKGEDYHKDVLKQSGHDMMSQGNAEENALAYLEKIAKQKAEQRKNAFSNGARFGDGSYTANGKPLNIDEATADVNGAEDKAREYREYLEAKKKKNPKLSATARFSLDGKDYSNPLYNEKERKSINQSQKPTPDDVGIFDSENFWSSVWDKTSKALTSNSEDKVQDEDRLDTIKVPKDDLHSVMRGIAAAETGPITRQKDINDESRSIRTKGGADSSAYGPYQITYSLADAHLKKGLFDNDPALKDWTKERFVPHGKKMLKTSYQDPKYGAGGSGDLSSDKDRDMYQKMSEAIIGDSLSRNKGDTLAVLGEHRFGHSKKHTLLESDPNYAQRAMEQWKKDQQTTLASSNTNANVAPVSQASTQVALNQLSKEHDASRSSPVIVTVPTPAPAPQPVQASGGVSTKSVGASPNGASDSSLMLGIRHSVSPLT